ncbi:MAG: GldG family protein, partial [Bacteroidetes bacterium]|nr:GldG family protein [Bacteroidota bacterium]
MKNRKTAVYYILIIIGVIVLINILSTGFYFRLDFTADNQYTLSRATKDILKNLNEPVTVTAYFSEDLQPQFAQVRRDFKDMLEEYASISGGMVVYEFINPNEEEEAEQKAMRAGIQPVLISSREKDQSVQKKAYLGAVVQLGENSETIPFIPPGAAMEYTLSSSIKKLSVTEKPLIGLVQGHGEPSMQAIFQAVQGLQVLYDVEPVYFSDTSYNLDTYSTLAIVAPTDS